MSRKRRIRMEDQKGPDYGSMGSPSMGHIVRLHMGSFPGAATIPAQIRSACVETGSCLLVYDVIHMDGRLTREYSRDVPFGPQKDESQFWWDWLPEFKIMMLRTRSS
jgi:hypothetical protein